MNWDYIAGFMDGEGCICLSRNRCKIDITQLTANSDVLYEIRDFIDGYGIHSWVCLSRRSNPHSGGTISHLCMSSMSGCYLFLMELFPRLRVKKAKAQIAISLLEPKITARLDLMKRLELAIADYNGGMSSIGVEKKYGVWHATLRNEMKRRNIVLRSRSEANRLGKSYLRLLRSHA